MMGKLILAFIMIQTKGLRATGNEARGGLRVAASKEGNVVPGVDKRFRQIRDDTFRPPVELGRDTLIKGCYLGYFQ
jgi:hypothetical protein